MLKYAVALAAAMLIPCAAHADEGQEVPFQFNGNIYITGGYSLPCTAGFDGILAPNFTEKYNGQSYYIGSVCADYTGPKSIFFWLYRTATPGFIADAYIIECDARTIQRVKHSTGRTEVEIAANAVLVTASPGPIGVLPPGNTGRALCFNRGFW